MESFGTIEASSFIFVFLEYIIPEKYHFFFLEK